MTIYLVEQTKLGRERIPRGDDNKKSESKDEHAAGWAEVLVEKRISPLRCSRKCVSSFGRNDGSLDGEKKENSNRKTKYEIRGFFAAFRTTGLYG
jgi:hypothetical protein